jgi:NitT/TauT family transport system ATP-binding protein
MSFIALEKVCKSYSGSGAFKNQKHEVLKDFSISVERQQIVTFFGPNACGKSTLLNLIAGLIPADAGDIKIDSKPPCETKIGYVFQNFQLSFLPWRKNIDNIAFPLELQGVTKEERRERVIKFLENLEIALPLYSYPYQLSGGQQQLLAIARAMIFEPLVLLLDEPFNQLDYQTRISMQEKLLNIWEKTKTTILFVSHDLDEAILLGNKVVFLSKLPAKILEVIDNNLPVPRKHNIVQTQDFFSLRNQGLRIFEKALKT